MAEKTPDFATLAIHAGAQPDPTTGARVTPIYQTTSFVFEDVEHAANLFALNQLGNIYTRLTNPTVSALQERLAALEGGIGATATASGHSAQILALLPLMEPGDHIVASKKLYGGSLNQMSNTFRKFGWQTTFVEPDDVENFRKAVTPAHQGVLHRGAGQSRGRRRRYRGGGQDRARGRRAADRRQHPGNAVSVPSV